MTTITKRNNTLLAWAVGAAVAAVAAPTVLLVGAAPAHADDYGLLAAANAQRAKDGCPAWASNPTLLAAAQSHAQDSLKLLAAGTYPQHTGSDGSTPASRATANGWTGSQAGEIQTGGTGGPGSTDVATWTAGLAPFAIGDWTKPGDGHGLAFSDCTTTDAGAAIATDSSGWFAVITAAKH